MSPSVLDENPAARALRDRSLRLAVKAARRAVGGLLVMLDAAGHGGGRAIELVDESLECLVEAERSLWVAGPARVSTEPLRVAVERARAAAAERRAA